MEGEPSKEEIDRIINLRKKELERDKNEAEQEIIDTIMRDWLLNNYSIDSNPLAECTKKCNYKEIPRLEGYYGCKTHSKFHICKGNNCPVIYDKAYDICEITGRMIWNQVDGTEESIPRKRGVGARSTEKIQYHPNSLPIINSIFTDLFYNDTNRTVSFEVLYDETEEAAAKAVLAYIDKRKEVFEGDTQMPSPVAVQLVEVYEAQRSAYDVLGGRPISRLVVPDTWKDLKEFVMWKGFLEFVVHNIWCFMEENGFKKRTSQRIQEITIYILYVMRYNRVLSLGGVTLLDFYPPLLDFLPPDNALEKLEAFAIVNYQYRPTNFSSGKQILTTFFQALSISGSYKIKELKETIALELGRVLAGNQTSKDIFRNE